MAGNVDFGLAVFCLLLGCVLVLFVGKTISLWRRSGDCGVWFAFVRTTRHRYKLGFVCCTAAYAALRISTLSECQRLRARPAWSRLMHTIATVFAAFAFACVVMYYRRVFIGSAAVSHLHARLHAGRRDA